MAEEPTEDEMTFGKGRLVYCAQHLRPHVTGWCTVGVGQKTKLLADNTDDAYAECKQRGFHIYTDK